MRRLACAAALVRWGPWRGDLHQYLAEPAVGDEEIDARQLVACSSARAFLRHQHARVEPVDLAHFDQALRFHAEAPADEDSPAEAEPEPAEEADKGLEEQKPNEKPKKWRGQTAGDPGKKVLLHRCEDPPRLQRVRLPRVGSP